MPRPQPAVPGPGQDCIWDYPSPPAVVAVSATVKVILGDEVVAQSDQALRLLERGCAPQIYVPPRHVMPDALQPSGTRPSLNRWVGVTLAMTVTGGGEIVRDGAWSITTPQRAYEMLTGYIAFSCMLMDECWIGDDQATPEPGGSQLGWVTPIIVGPFARRRFARRWR